MHFWKKRHAQNRKGESEVSNPEELLGAGAERVLSEEQAEVVVDTGQEADGRERYEEIFGRFFPTLLAFAVHHVGRRAIAEELVQDAFLRLFKNWKRYSQEYKTEDDVKRLVYRIVRNIVIDHWRQGHNPGDATAKGDEEQEIIERSGTVDTSAPQEETVLLTKLLQTA